MDTRDLAGQAFYLYNGKVLARRTDNSGYVLDPQPILVRSSYSPSAANLESLSTHIHNALTEVPPTNLLYIMSSPDGPPYRLARLFYKAGNDHLVLDGGRYSISASVFYPIGEASQPWDKDTHRLQPGLFVTGSGGPTNIWRIHRIERDIWGGPLFTLAPLLLAPGFPMLDLSGMGNADRKKEIASQYEELQRCVITHAYRGAIARAKDIAEALITEKSAKSSSDPFHAKLEDIFVQLKAGKTSLSWLTFTLCQKLRLVYKHTHPENALERGRPVTPELALSVVEDLIEILRDLGHVKETPADAST